ncbi:hypothetical protein Btru_066180 [Bulinus truncatus]|nr:hypothetical protein Btru_066180 [Bulinus truncatus]
MLSHGVPPACLTDGVVVDGCLGGGDQSGSINSLLGEIHWCLEYVGAGSRRRKPCGRVLERALPYLLGVERGDPLCALEGVTLLHGSPVMYLEGDVSPAVATLCLEEEGISPVTDLLGVPDATIVTFPTQATAKWLTDSNDTTCNVDINIQSLNISWNTAYPFTWLRFILNDATHKLDFNLTFSTKLTPLINCDRQEIFDLDGEAVDYVCDVNETIQELTVTGAGLKSLCSFYISGGRNIALKEEAAQSTVFPHSGRGDALSAVDGSTNGEYNNGTCTHTLHEDISPSWTLTLSTAKVINRYILYNRGDCCQNRLQYFKLETFDAKNNVLWRYQDKRDILNVYTVTSIMKDPVSKIKISATNRVDNWVVLTLCEVLVFGECVPGTWGLDCNQTCPEDCDTLCHPENGACGLCLGCSTECDKGRWGKCCQKNCKEHCYDKVCDRATGYCTNGCNGYSDPPYCSKAACSKGWFGSNCQYMCTVKKIPNVMLTVIVQVNAPEDGLVLGCQYQDLASVPDATIVTFPTQTTTEWLTDSNDTTCNADINIQSLNISWNTSYPFTWIRFILKDATLKLNFNLTFGTKWTPLINCDRQEIFDLDGETVDHVCDVKETIQELTVTGAGLKSLCSFTSVEIVSPSWTLTLSTAKVISRYILYNRGDCCQSRLQYFKLETFDAKNNVLWWYQDKREILNVYTVTSIMKDPVKCVPGTWGLDCNQTCPEDCDTLCHPENGTCALCLGCGTGKKSIMELLIRLRQYTRTILTCSSRIRLRQYTQDNLNLLIIRLRQYTRTILTCSSFVSDSIPGQS